MERVVLHSDLNNCYASIECMLHPELRGKYIAVCGSTEDRQGIVLAKNQLAKKCGVKTGDVIWEAKQKCPQLTIVPPHMDQYLKFSKIVREIYMRYSSEGRRVRMFMENMSYADIARAESCSQQASRMSLLKAFRKLRRLLEGRI